MIGRRLLSTLAAEKRGHIFGEGGDEVVIGLDGSGVTRVSASVDRALTIPVVYSGVARISGAFRSMPLRLDLWADGAYRNTPSELRLRTLLCERPNPEMSSGELWELLTAWMILRGDAFAWKERRGGRVVALWPVSPDRVQVVRNTRTGAKEFLVYPSSEDPTPMWAGDASDVIHFRGWGTDPMRGMGVVQAMSALVKYTRTEQEHQATQLTNMRRPSGVLQAPAGMSNEAMQRLAAGWAQRAKGGTPILNDGVEWRGVSMTAADAQFIEQRRFTRSEWALVMQLPASMAMTDVGGSLHYDSAEMNGQEFVTYTTAPWAARIADALRDDDSLPWGYTGSEKGRLYPRFDTSNFTRADDMKRAQANRLEIAAGTLTPEEVRVAEGRVALADTPDAVAPAPVDQGGADAATN